MGGRHQEKFHFPKIPERSIFYIDYLKASFRTKVCCLLKYEFNLFESNADLFFPQ